VTAHHGRATNEPAGSPAQRRQVRVHQPSGDGVEGRPQGTLVAIGGGEGRDPGSGLAVLGEIARLVRERRVVLIAAASTEPQELIRVYRAAFRHLGIQRVDSIDIESHQDAYAPDTVRLLAGAGAVFFTGGDQTRITSLIGGSPLLGTIEDFYRRGGLVAGSSAGAAAMPTVMLSGGAAGNNASGDIVLGPGLGLLPGTVVDTHFGQRGRMDRLIKAVARQPGLLGIGLDEDTALVLTGGSRMRVVGAGSVRIIDGTGITYSSFSDRGDQGILAVHHIMLHTLGPGDHFDLHRRIPSPADQAADRRRA
jgi:cyanophycinase